MSQRSGGGCVSEEWDLGVLLRLGGERGVRKVWWKLDKEVDAEIDMWSAIERNGQLLIIDTD